jgi:hypothetical protein
MDINSTDIRRWQHFQTSTQENMNDLIHTIALFRRRPIVEPPPHRVIMAVHVEIQTVQPIGVGSFGI